MRAYAGSSLYATRNRADGQKDEEETATRAISIFREFSVTEDRVNGRSDPVPRSDKCRALGPLSTNAAMDSRPVFKGEIYVPDPEASDTRVRVIRTPCQGSRGDKQFPDESRSPVDFSSAPLSRTFLARRVFSAARTNLGRSRSTITVAQACTQYRPPMPLRSNERARFHWARTLASSSGITVTINAIVR